jgi:hypothetical protein
MKISRIFVIVMLIAFVVLLMVEMKLPDRFVWEPTFRHTDHNPFGSMLVDSLLSSSVKQGYDVIEGDIYDVFNDRSSQNKSIILAGMSINEKVLEMVKRGQNVLWLGEDGMTEQMEKTFNIQLISPIISRYADLSKLTTADTLFLAWPNDNNYKKRIYKLPDLMQYHISMLILDGSDAIPLLESRRSDTYNGIYAVKVRYGKGQLIIVTLPELFTNYYLLEPGGAELLMRLVSQLGDAPIVRCDNSAPQQFLDEEVESQSPLRFLMKHKSLRWALYLTLLAVALSLFFTARRRQRIIPEVKAPENQNVNMVKHLGLMYYRYHDNASLVREKYAILVKELRRKLLIDIASEMNDDENFMLLANRTSLNTDMIKNCILRSREIVDDENIELHDTEAQSLIDEMNNILRNL